MKTYTVATLSGLRSIRKRLQLGDRIKVPTSSSVSTREIREEALANPDLIGMSDKERLYKVIGRHSLARHVDKAKALAEFNRLIADLVPYMDKSPSATDAEPEGNGLDLCFSHNYGFRLYGHTLEYKRMTIDPDDIATDSAQGFALYLVIFHGASRWHPEEEDEILLSENTDFFRCITSGVGSYIANHLFRGCQMPMIYPDQRGEEAWI